MKKQLIITMAMAASLLHGGPVHAVTNNIIQPDIVETTFDPLISVENFLTEETNNINNIINQLDSPRCLFPGLDDNFNQAISCYFISDESSSLSDEIITFTFNNVVTIKSFLLWNGAINQGINQFELFLDNNSNFSDNIITKLSSKTTFMDNKLHH